MTFVRNQREPMEIKEKQGKSRKSKQIKENHENLRKS